MHHLSMETRGIQDQGEAERMSLVADSSMPCLLEREAQPGLSGSLDGTVLRDVWLWLWIR